jgi:hypothetical protein
VFGRGEVKNLSEVKNNGKPYNSLSSGEGWGEVKEL